MSGRHLASSHNPLSPALLYIADIQTEVCVCVCVGGGGGGGFYEFSESEHLYRGTSTPYKLSHQITDNFSLQDFFTTTQYIYTLHTFTLSEVLDTFI